ncbi:MAG: aldehyde ferredoxin oxidoreductase family protein [Planctomycetota bacterium]|jgi:aldehyde:ferredoxin oxidoreductase
MSNTNTIAHIELESRRIEFEVLDPALIRKWGGGSGLASWQLYNELTPHTEALGSDSVVWIIGGPMTGTAAPSSGRLEVVNKSAVNGLLGHSNTGGMFGARLKHAGLDGLVIRGVSPDPVYLLVRSGKIEFRDATHLWGKDIWETEEQIGAELDDPKLKRIKIMAIGPAGEKQVRFACPINERYHAAARGGAGAVLGAKNVKAIVADAESSPPFISQAFQAAAARATKKIKDNQTCQNYKRYGSANVSDYWNEIGCFSGLNFQFGALPRWRGTRGTDKMKSFVTRPDGSCYRCPMPCFNRVEVPEGKYKGLKITSGTFVQSVIAFGAKCGLESLPAIWKCKEICHRLGMDYDSASGVVAFAMELYEKQLLTIKDTGGLKLTWGNESAVMKLLRQIAQRQGLGDILAEGSVRASKTIGPHSTPYVMTIKGLEMISSDVRAAPRGWSLGSLTNSRGGDNLPGSHMKGDSLPVLHLLKPENRSDWETFSNKFVSELDMFEDIKAAIYGDPPLVNPFTYQGKALMTKWFEDLLYGVNALGLCTFPADKLALGPTTYADLLSGYLGEEIEPQEYMQIGERIFNIQRLFVIREGVSRKNDTWPNRFFEEKLPPGPAQGGAVVDRETIDRVLDEYYDARGWERTSGHPTLQTLNRLDLPRV